MVRKTHLDDLNWDNIFEYKAGNLYWKISPSNNTKAGSLVGSLTLKGYRRFEFRNKNYSVHRIIWEMFNGPIPEGLEIDHINGIRDDNQIENLRLANRNQNCCNALRIKRDLPKGIQRKYGKYHSSIWFKRKYYWLGSYETLEDAIAARELKSKLLHGEFAYDR